jgi:4-amino-4-deoxy-L-arabinose transferase-like glycosyltransferase
LLRLKIIFFAVIALAFSLRFFQLAHVPSSLYWDEVSLGYNAWNISETLKDEHGKFLPVAAFEAYGDYKPPVYVYAVAASIKVFGANDFSIRFPSALFGTISILAAFFIAKKLFKNSKIWLFTALFLSISPWALNLSRVAFEANLAWSLFLIAFALFLYEKYIFSIIFFAITFYTFNSSRIFIPIFLIIISFVFYKRVIARKMTFIFCIFLFVLILAPLVPHLMSKEGRLRFQEVNIFTNPVPVNVSNSRIQKDNNAIWSKIINNRRIYIAEDFLKHFSDNFRFDFLFLTGDKNGTFSNGKNGELYLLDALLIAIGIYFLLTKEKKGNLKLILLSLWVAAGLIPAGVARETPHALRTLNALPVYQILSALGIVFFLKRFPNKFIRIGCLLIIIVSFIFYLNNYYHSYTVDNVESFQYGYSQMVEFVSENQNKYDKIFITNFYGRPYIYFLWYDKIPSQEFLNNSTSSTDSFGFYNVSRIGKVYFSLPDNLNEKKVLYVGGKDDETKLKSLKLVNTINFPNGKPDFYFNEN